MGNGDNFTADEIVESIQCIRKNEAIADPDARFHRLANLGNVVKGALVTVLKNRNFFEFVGILLKYLIGLALVLGIVAQHVETVLGAQRHHVVVFAPVDLH